jgi:hypothetical protein
LKGTLIVTTTSFSALNLIVFPLVLVGVCGGLVYAGVNGLIQPRIAILITLVAGMAACTAGIGQVAGSGHWASPLAIVGYLLGAAILVFTLAGLFGWKLPLAQTSQEALLAMGVLIATKMILGFSGLFLRLF